MKNCFILLLILFVSSNLNAQKIFTGIVLNAKTEQPVSNALISINGADKISTDESGKFYYELKELTGYALVSHDEYIEKIISIPDTSFITIDLFPIHTQLSSVIVTANRLDELSFSSPRTMSVVGRRELDEEHNFSVLDAFDDKIGIWIEKRTTSTSDPVIRGLSGANILGLVDGNSFSTFWGEGGFAGDDMYGKIDPGSVHQIEVVRGPASLMYGSNALGGVINFIMKESPLDYTKEGYENGHKLSTVYGTQGTYLSGRVETWGATEKFRYFAGVSTHISDDVYGGGDIGKMTATSARDHSFDLNTEYKLNKKSFVKFSGQYMNRPEVYRFYRPSQSNTNLRMAGKLSFVNYKRNFLYDKFEFSVYSQKKRDERFWYSSPERDTLQMEGYALWNSFETGFNAVKKLKKSHRLVYGVSYHIDMAESPDDEQFTMIMPDGDQKASPDTRWHNIGAYLYDEWEVLDWMSLSAGARFDKFMLIADDNIFYLKPGETDSVKNPALTDPGEYQQEALTGSFAAIFHLTKDLNLVANWSHGYRMIPPSFGFRQTGQGVLIPNGLLDPVKADMFELSARYRSKLIDFNITSYYTAFNDFQHPTFGEFEGETHIDYNNNGSFEPDERVYVNTPDGTAWVAGVEAELEYSLIGISKSLSDFSFYAGSMYNYGSIKFPDVEEQPFRHTHPFRTLLKLRYKNSDFRYRNLWFELCADLVGKYTRINPDRLNSDVGYLLNPQDPTSGLYHPDGLPAYQVFDFRAGFYISRKVVFSFAVNNIFDTAYRSAHSRMDALGRNLIFGLDIEF